MGPADPPTAAAVLALLGDREREITAAISLVLAFGLAAVVNRLFEVRGRRLAEAVGRGELSPEVRTRVRFVKRLVLLAIIVVGVSVAISQFSGLNKLATSILASSALAAAVVGFAARQVLANVVAGVMLAVAQPLRVGDQVTFEDEAGVVEDVRLNHTVIRQPSGRRVVVPNEKIAGGLLRNDSLGGEDVGVEVSVWLPPSTDAERAIETLGAALPEVGVAVAEAVPEGVRLGLDGGRVPAADRPVREGELRRAALRVLREAGLLATTDDLPRAPGGTRAGG